MTGRLTDARRHALGVLAVGERTGRMVWSSNATTSDVELERAVEPGRLTLGILAQTARWLVDEGYAARSGGRLTFTDRGRQLAADEGVEILRHAACRIEPTPNAEGDDR